MFKVLIHMCWFSIIAIVCSVMGSFLMFIVGAMETFKAFKVYFRLTETEVAVGDKLLGIDTMVKLVAALDSFLFAMVLFYFAFGIYYLFIKSNESTEEGSGLMNKLPKWLQVKSLGELKKTLMEVIIVLIAVLFLKDVLYLQTGSELQWQVLIAPIATIAFAIVLKLVKFEEH